MNNQAPAPAPAAAATTVAATAADENIPDDEEEEDTEAAAAATAAATAAAVEAVASMARAAAAEAALNDMHMRVHLAARENQPASTRKSYGPVKVIFKAFCRYKFEEDEDGEHEPAEEWELITKEKKIFLFLYYVAFRKRHESDQAWTFDPDNYEDTIQRHVVAQGTQDDLLRYPENDYIGYSSFKIARAALRELLMEQRSEHRGTDVFKKLLLPSCLNDDMAVAELKKMVAARKTKSMYARNSERMSSKQELYTHVKYVEPLEEKFWICCDGSNNKGRIMVAYRNRFYLLSFSSRFQILNVDARSAGSTKGPTDYERPHRTAINFDHTKND
jgi:hypothetical protein